MKNNKLQGLLKKLDSLEKSLPLDETKVYLDTLLETETKKFQDGFKSNPSVKFLNDLDIKLEKFKKDFDLEPVIKEIEDIQEDISETKDKIEKDFKSVSESTEDKLEKLTELIKGVKNDLSSMTGKEIKGLLGKISNLEKGLSFQEGSSKQEGLTLKQVMNSFQNRLTEMSKSLAESSTKHIELNKNTEERFNKTGESLKGAVIATEELRKEMMRQFGRFGGSMNRKITFGDVDYLTRYTDINYKAGKNVSFTISNNDQTKMVDVTITGTSTGGSVRVIASVSTDTTAGATSGTDYVFLVTGTTKITLPTAVGNTNLYTIKNVGVGVVTVDTTSSQTIDGDLTIIMPVRYTSVDLISDTANWNVT